MFSRIVALVQIAAIIACPLRCGSDLCHAEPCGSQEHASPTNSLPTTCGEDSSAHCCCTERIPSAANANASANEHASDEPSPSPCPCSDSSCQGVCGGAVFAKPVEFSMVTDSIFLSMVDARVSVDSQFADSRSQIGEFHWRGSSGNQGRFVRTLHKSFLN